MPLEALPPVCGEICTPTAVAPGPVYATGIVTGAGATADADVGTAVTVTGPPLKTVSPAALMYARFKLSGSPLAGALGRSFTSSVNGNESVPAAKSTTVSIATVPSEWCSTIRTLSNGTMPAAATPAVAYAAGNCVCHAIPRA